MKRKTLNVEVSTTVADASVLHLLFLFHECLSPGSDPSDNAIMDYNEYFNCHFSFSFPFFFFMPKAINFNL